jgi:hypothetical protein
MNQSGILKKTATRPYTLGNVLPAQDGVSKMRRIASAFLFAFVVSSLIACGGGSSTPVPTPTPPPSIVVTPSSANVNIGGSQTFTSNAAGVTWSITGPGSISQNGAYLAPATFPGVGANTVTVTATAGAQVGHANAAVVFPNDNAGNQAIPVKLGTSGGNVLDNNTANTACCIGTLGSLLQRGTTLYILSNNHVLARSTLGKAGEAIDQPGQPHCPAGSQGLTVANLSEQAALKPAAGTTGPAPSNVDAAIAQIVTGTVDPSGSILDLGTAGSTSIAAAPPSSTVDLPAIGQPVAKSGRTTGLTCSTVGAVGVSVSVQYDQSCGGAVAFTATFSNQISVNGGSFSAGGDSGSLIVTSNTSHPVGLLYAGSSTDTVANPMADVFKAFTTAAGTPAIVGGAADHAVSCDPTNSVQSAQVGAASAAVGKLSAQERQRVTTVLQSNQTALTRDPAVRNVQLGASMDSTGEGAVEIHVTGPLQKPVPATIDGVRTRVVYQGAAVKMIPSRFELNNPAVVRASAVKDAHVASLMAQPGIQGVGVTRSDDNPVETAILIYTIKGVAHNPIPAVIDGVRTKIVDTDRFRANGWNSQLEPKTGACSKAPANGGVKTSLK